MHNSDVETRDVLAHEAARRLYNQLNPGSSTVMTTPAGGGDSILESDYKKMSPVRRTFCLVALFDLAFIFLLWIIYSQLSGMSVKQIFVDQVLNYSIQSSMFDSVMLAAGRFVLLELGYALFKLKHWWVVALTTFISSGFLLAKVFVYDFHEDSTTASTLDYVLLTCGFIICWLEAWFLDFKVIPDEKKSEFLAWQHQVYASQVSSERAPLLRGAIPNYTNSHSGETGSSHGAFYSPYESSESECEYTDAAGDQPPHSHTRARHRSGDAKHIDLGKKAHAVLNDIVNSTDAWRPEKKSGTDSVYSVDWQGIGKCFILQAEVKASSSNVYDLLITKMHEAPSWNPTLLENRVLQHVNEHVDVVYTVTADAGSGTVSSRDFVTARYVEKRNGVYLSAGTATVHPDMPQNGIYVRGENRVAGYVIKPVKEDSSKCLFTWVVNSNLKGWLPTALIEQGIASMMLDFMTHLRKHIDDTVPREV